MHRLHPEARSEHDSTVIDWEVWLVVRLCADRLCGLVVTVPGCRTGGLGFDSQRYHIFSLAVGLNRGHSAS
jgi:hypothetical protein